MDVLMIFIKLPFTFASFFSNMITILTLSLSILNVNSNNIVKMFVGLEIVDC